MDTRDQVRRLQNQRADQAQHCQSVYAERERLDLSFSGHLRFAGKVGTGFTSDVLAEMQRRLKALEQKECPFSPKPAGSLGPNTHWVKPALVAEVEFTEWTEDGEIRHPSFQGLREDKPASEIIRENPGAMPNERFQSASNLKAN